MSEAIDDMEAYSKLNDSILDLIRMDPNPKLDKAREILDKVDKRQLYKCVGQTRPIATKKIDKTEIAKFTQQIANAMTPKELDGRAPLKPEDYLVQVARFDFGMGAENPIDKVYFYSKDDPERPKRIRKEDVSFMLPERFQEQLIRVYCRSSSPDDIDVATKCFQRWCASDNIGIARVG